MSTGVVAPWYPHGGVKERNDKPVLGVAQDAAVQKSPKTNGTRVLDPSACPGSIGAIMPPRIAETQSASDKLAHPWDPMHESPSGRIQWRREERKEDEGQSPSTSSPSPTSMPSSCTSRRSAPPRAFAPISRPTDRHSPAVSSSLARSYTLCQFVWLSRRSVMRLLARTTRWMGFVVLSLAAACNCGQYPVSSESTTK